MIVLGCVGVLAQTDQKISAEYLRQVGLGDLLGSANQLTVAGSGMILE